MRKSRAGDTESRTNGNFGREERILRIAVLIKQVPAVDTVKIDEKTGTMIRDGVEAELNPLDLHAVEAAVRLKESRPAGEVEITAVTYGAARGSEGRALRDSDGLRQGAAAL